MAHLVCHLMMASINHLCGVHVAVVAVLLTQRWCMFDIQRRILLLLRVKAGSSVITAPENAQVPIMMTILEC
jgi:hypothetical protein